MNIKALFVGKRTGKNSARSRAGTFFLMLLILILGAFTGLPFVYAIMQAFKPMDEIFLFPPRFFVVRPTWDNFYLLTQYANNLWVSFERYLFNSLFYTVFATTAEIFVCSAAAYVLAKGSLKYRNAIFSVIVMALLFTYDVTAIPSYVVMAGLKLLDTVWAIILPSIAVPLGLFLMKQFMESNVPDALLEAARIDGASPFRLYWSISMPLVKPAWLTLIIFAFQQIWNREGLEYIYSESLKTLPTMLKQISTGGMARAGMAAAAAVVLMLPPIIAFIGSQSRIVETMSHSGIK
jgi:ABC-type glycerol-3-phosphate transport system permease component